MKQALWFFIVSVLIIFVLIRLESWNIEDSKNPKCPERNLGFIADGMSKEDVERIFGKPLKITTEYNYGLLKNVSFEDGKVVNFVWSD